MRALNEFDMIGRLVQWHRCIVDGDRAASWAARRTAATAPLGFRELADLHRVAESLHHDTGAELHDRLIALGARSGFYGRFPELHLGAWWFIAPMADAVLSLQWSAVRLHWCHDETPSEWGDDWFCDDLDAGVADDVRVQILGDGLTLLMMDGHGLAVVETSRRVEPRALKSRRLLSRATEVGP